MAKGSKHKKAMVIRKAPNSFGVYTSRPFLIRINDVPQISDRKIRINQAMAGVLLTAGIGVTGLVGLEVSMGVML